MSNADGGQCEHNEALMASSQQELLDRLRAVEEERNSLRNEVDTVRSELSGSLEVEQLQHAVTRNMLQRVKEDLAQQGDHMRELREKLQITEQELVAARRACEDSLETIRAKAKRHKHQSSLRSNHPRSEAGHCAQADTHCQACRVMRFRWRLPCRHACGRCFSLSKALLRFSALQTP